jgi:hypothetical protein
LLQEVFLSQSSAQSTFRRNPPEHLQERDFLDRSRRERTNEHFEKFIIETPDPALHNPHRTSHRPKRQLVK